MRAVRIRALTVALLTIALILALAPFERAAAQDFPSRPVRFVVPYAAGGSGDLLARLLGNKLASIWGQQVVIDNRPGAGGLIGTEFAAHSEPDGYTLYLATDGPLTIAGDVSMFLVGTSTAVPYVRGLAVTSSHRVQGLPDVPTFAEAGLPGVDVSIWFAVLVPGGTPPAIVGKLSADIAQVVADPEFKNALAVRGFEAQASAPEQLADFLDKDYVKFRDLIQRLGLQVE